MGCQECIDGNVEVQLEAGLLLEGINSITSERLSEEGIDCIQQLALCDYVEIQRKTKFPIDIVRDWKDQAIFYMLTADVIIHDDTKKRISSMISLTENSEYVLSLH